MKFCCLITSISSFLIVSSLGFWVAFPVSASGQTTAAQATTPQGKIPLSGPIRIAKLLWATNPLSAKSTLEGAIAKAIERGQVEELRKALEPLRPLSARVFESADASDPRHIVSAAVQLLLHSEMRDDAARIETILNSANSSEDAGLLLRVWLATDEKRAMDFFARRLASTDAADSSSTMIPIVFSANRELAAQKVLEVWADLAPASQLAAIEPLTTTKNTMMQLVEAVNAGRVSTGLINANQLRKWLQAGDTELKQAIEAVWGQVRETDNVARQELVAKTLQLLNSGAKGSVSRGEKIFTRVCSQCHVLHGQGFEVGPNIAGNGRGSLQQLVSNVLDPSLVIGEAFQAKTVLTYDGEVVSGLVVAENETFLKLKVQGGKIVEFDKEEDIQQLKASEKSLMPEGVEAQMSQQEMIDLFAFLCLLKPLGDEANELIPGTPEQLVNP